MDGQRQAPYHNRRYTLMWRLRTWGTRQAQDTLHCTNSSLTPNGDGFARRGDSSVQLYQRVRAMFQAEYRGIPREASDAG